MITSIFLSIPSTTTYQQLKKPLTFQQDIYGISNWVMRFPLTIYSDTLEQKHTFNSDKVEVSKTPKPNLQQKWKYFVITRGDGSRYYCTSHIFYEKHPLQQQPQKSLFSSLRTLHNKYPEYYLPKCLVIVCKQPLFKLEHNLIKIYRELRLGNKDVMPVVYEEGYRRYHESWVGRVGDWETMEVKHRGKYRTFTIQENFQYYIDICNSNFQSDQKNKIYINPSNNLQILHIYNLHQPYHHHQTHSQSLYRFNYFTHLPLSSDTLLQTLTAIFLQKQIIFTSSNQNLNVMAMQTIRQMIRPFSWDFMYVPNLPSHMLDVIEQSFMPFMVGIHKKYVGDVDCRDKIVVYLDANVIEGVGEESGVPSCLRYCLGGWSNKVYNEKYIENQKELRIRSLQNISKLIERAYEVDCRRETKFRLSTTSNLLDDQFYQQFTTSSTMYHRYKQSLSNPHHSNSIKEIKYLLSLPSKNRDQYIVSKFNIVMSMAQQPEIVDNQKEIIRYFYHKYERVGNGKGVSKGKGEGKNRGDELRNSQVQVMGQVENINKKVDKNMLLMNQQEIENYYSENTNKSNKNRNMPISLSPRPAIHKYISQTQKHPNFYKSTVLQQKLPYTRKSPKSPYPLNQSFLTPPQRLYYSRTPSNLPQTHNSLPNAAQIKTQKPSNKTKKIVVKKCGISFVMGTEKL